MRILVTGGAGFIGSHIVDAYLAKGHSVAVLDNLQTGFRKNVHSKARFYRADIRDAGKIGSIIRKEQPQIVNHHAAIAEVVKSLRDPVPTTEVNVIGTMNTLAAFGELSRAKKKKFIFASTGGALYGEPSRIPVTENTPINPLSVYGLSKKMAEDAVRFYARRFGFDHLIFRYANVYGPRQNPKGEAGVVAIFGGLLRSGTQPVIFGDGRKTRDYVHVSDIVRANVLGLSKGKGVELNLGLGREISDRQVFDVIASHYGHKAEPEHAPHREGEVRRVTLDAEKAKKAIGWKARVSFEDGVSATLMADFRR